MCTTTNRSIRIPIIRPPPHPTCTLMATRHVTTLATNAEMTMMMKPLTKKAKNSFSKTRAARTPSLALGSRRALPRRPCLIALP